MLGGFEPYDTIRYDRRD